MLSTQPTQSKSMDLCWVGVKGRKVDSHSENTVFVRWTFVDGLACFALVLGARGAALAPSLR